jgi:hypothetical protein
MEGLAAETNFATAFIVLLQPSPTTPALGNTVVGNRRHEDQLDYAAKAAQATKHP